MYICDRERRDKHKQREREMEKERVEENGRKEKAYNNKRP